MLGDKEHPLRCSKLASIVKCSMRIYLLMIEDLSDEDGVVHPTAHTGSVVHAGVAEFHRRQNESLSIRTQEGWNAIAKAMGKFPLADETEVRLFFQPYINDPRNIHAEIPLWFDGTPAVEKEISFTLPPHEIDQTEMKIYVEGTLDQLRLVNQIPLVADLKTGKKTGWEMLHDYAIQLIAYCYGVRQVAQKSIKESIDSKEIDRALKLLDTQPGHIIRNYGYRQRKEDIFGNKNLSPDGIFWPSLIKVNKIELLLELVRMHVALYRNGHIQFGVGPHCTYCEHGGLLNCTNKYEELTLKHNH